MAVTTDAGLRLGVGFHTHTHRALLCTMSNVYLRGSEFSKSLRNNFFEMKMHRDEIFWAVPRLLGI